MTHSSHFEYLPESLVRAMQHSEAHRGLSHDGLPAEAKPLSIAISREVGAGATTIAHELGRRLTWAVYDHELLERMAGEMNVRVALLESVDERHVNWLQESVEAFSSTAMVREMQYVRHLVETIFGLAAHGRCIIVGRGAAMILPANSTLRVRLIAPLEQRIATMSNQLSLTKREAARYIDTTQRERNRFVRDHFQCDVTDPLGYDLILNTARFTVAECAEQIEGIVRQLQARQASRRG